MIKVITFIVVCSSLWIQAVLAQSPIADHKDLGVVISGIAKELESKDLQRQLSEISNHFKNATSKEEISKYVKEIKLDSFTDYDLGHGRRIILGLDPNKDSCFALVGGYFELRLQGCSNIMAVNALNCIQRAGRASAEESGPSPIYLFWREFIKEYGIPVPRLTREILKVSDESMAVVDNDKTYIVELKNGDIHFSGVVNSRFVFDSQFQKAVNPNGRFLSELLIDEAWRALVSKEFPEFFDSLNQRSLEFGPALWAMYSQR